MHTKPAKKPAVNVITLGCSKNVWDSEVLMGQIAAGEMEVKHDGKSAKGDTVVINTCGFIDKAKQESIDTILEYAEARRKGRIGKLIVMGCLSERYGSELADEMPDVDAFFGTRELPKVLKSIGIDYRHELLGERRLTTPGHFAYFKIAEGCDRPCSFCAIPLMRGKHLSTPLEELERQAKSLVANGTKELILIAQDLTFYGLDLYGKRSLDQLLLRLSDIEGLDWIRLQYAYPSQFPFEILPIMAERENICKYLDMPLQHATDNMLKTMRRGITRRRTEEVLDKIRTAIPDIALRTTMLVGHPGETEAEFEELMRFTEAQKFDRLGVFTYSHEENTHAGTLVDDVPEEVKEERSERLMELQRDISLEKNSSRVGSTLKVLIDRVEGAYYVGRTEYDSPEVDNEVLIKGDDNTYLRVGDFARVEITDAMEYDLFGRVAE